MRGSESKHSKKKHSSMLVWIVSEMLEMASAIEDAETAPRERLRANASRETHISPDNVRSKFLTIISTVRLVLRISVFVVTER